jgi:hypothetical protein
MDPELPSIYPFSMGITLLVSGNTVQHARAGSHALFAV